MALFVHDVDSHTLDPVRSIGPEVEIRKSLGNCDLVTGGFVYQEVALCIFCLVGTRPLDLVVAIAENEEPIGTGVSAEDSPDVVVPLFIKDSAYSSF